MSRSLAHPTWFTGSWWVLFPCFAALTSSLAVERACGDPYYLLPTLMAAPRWAWPIAAIYLATHLWLLTAYVITVSRRGKLVFSMREAASVWGTDTMKVVLMTAVLLVEYCPISVWQLLGGSLGCRP